MDLLLAKWRRFRKRPREDRALILLATVLLPSSMAGLRLFGFQRWKAIVQKLFTPSRSNRAFRNESERDIARRAALAIRSVELHGPTQPNCLERSITLWWLLRCAGIECELHIGARKEGGRFEAHAWIELSGQVLNDEQEVDHQYARFDGPIAGADSQTTGTTTSQ